MYKILLFIIALPAFSHPGSVHLAVGDNWHPYINTKDKNGGILITKMNRISSKLGKKFIYTYFPWGRAKKLGATGHYCGTFAWPDYDKKEFIASLPITTIHQHLYSRKKLENNIDDFKKLKGKTFCIPDNLKTPLVKKLESKGEIKTVLVNNTKQCFEMIVKGRIDFLHQDIVHTRETLSNPEYLEIVSHIHISKESVKTPMYLLMNKKCKHNKEFIKRFNEELLKLEP